MALTPGELYFIGEEDLKTKQKSNYFKIGIVRESEKRDSVNRLSEHQTGNPRRLFIAAQIQTPAVEQVETTLHHIFAPYRVSGEWMQFDDAQLTQAVNRALEIEKEMRTHVPLLTKAEGLGNQESNGQTIPASKEAEELYAEIQNNELIEARCDELIDQYRDLITVSIEAGVDLSNVAKQQTKAPTARFSEKLLKDKSPDLYAKYSEVITTVKGQFRVTPAQSWDGDIETINPEFFKAATNFEELIDIDVIDEELEFLIHDVYLEIKSFRKLAQWNIEKANTQLRVLTGTNDAIEGICTWKRTSSSKTVLDKDSLKLNHPEEYEACKVAVASSKSLILEPMAGYES